MAELPKDFAARVRAARAYAGIGSQATFGDMIGVSGTTVKNYEKEKDGTRPAERAVAETVKRLAKASGLPEWFFTISRLDSLRLGASEQSADQRLAEIERRVNEIAERLKGPPAPASATSIEDVAQQMRTLARTAEQLLSQQGRDIGKRDRERRHGRPDSPQEGVA